MSCYAENRLSGLFSGDVHERANKRLVFGRLPSSEVRVYPAIIQFETMRVTYLVRSSYWLARIRSQRSSTIPLAGGTPARVGYA
jgi:hypothetical protein